jgi:hypothetical protein
LAQIPSTKQNVQKTSFYFLKHSNDYLQMEVVNTDSNSLQW